MATKTNLIGICKQHGKYYMDSSDSPCPSCDEDAEDCEFNEIDGDWYCNTHWCLMISKNEPVICTKNPLHPDYKED